MTTTKNRPAPRSDVAAALLASGIAFACPGCGTVTLTAPGKATCEACSRHDRDAAFK